MRVISTRGGRGAPAVSLSEALAAGLAPDGGLYVPEAFPTFGPEDREALDARASLATVAQTILAPFFRDDPLEDVLPQLCAEAFSFPAPLVELVDGAEPRALEDGSLAGQAGDPGDPSLPPQALLELFHGPTAAFKDYAARFLAGALARIPVQGGRHVLVATSGDTGAAVAAAFHDRPGFRVTVLYPESGVSPRQAHLLGCFGDNVQAFRVQGSFDDCQRLVKGALTDPGLRRRHGLTSANSISLGRLLPQMAYHAHAALRWKEAFAAPGSSGTGEALPGFIIPSGNFGNALACLWARDLGLPIGEVILATNANRALVDWLQTGKADPRPVRRTLANAMDVGIPSNLERLTWQHSAPPSGVSGISLSDHEIRETLAEARRRWGQVVCPHTACGLRVLGDLRDGGDRRGWISVATAHPAKFPEVVEPEVGRTVPIPSAMAQWMERPSYAEPLKAEPRELARVLG
jgi:threonine synthase